MNIRAKARTAPASSRLWVHLKGVEGRKSRRGSPPRANEVTCSKIPLKASLKKRYYLLDVGRESKKSLRVRQESPRPVAEERGVPDPEEAHQHGDVLPGGLVQEMVVHVVSTVEETPGHFEAVVQGNRQHANGGADAVPAADPVPESEDVGGVHAKVLHQLIACAHSHLSDNDTDVSSGRGERGGGSHMPSKVVVRQRGREGISCSQYPTRKGIDFNLE